MTLFSKNLSIIVLPILILGAFCSFTQKKSNNLKFDIVASQHQDTSTFYSDVKVRKAFKLISDNKNNPNFIVIDVRAEDEYAEDHLPKAININYKSSNFSDKLDSLDKSKIYLVYCVAGYRSKKSENIMKEKGFKYIYNMQGGIIKWKSKKLPLESKNN